MKYGPARARYERRKRRRQMLQAYAGLWNFLSIFLGIGTIIIAIWFGWKLFDNPVINQETKIATTTISKASGQSDITVEPQITISIPTETLIPPTLVVPTVEDTSNYMFEIQARPESISARLFNQERTCNWMGVAGQAFDLQGRPIPGITVQITGPMNGKDIQFLSMTGSAIIYGDGGYEVFLSEKPIDTLGQFRIRLVDQEGRGLSPSYTFNTSSNCEKNLVILNFRQVK